MIPKLKFAAVAALLTAGIASSALAYGGDGFDHGYVPNNRMEQLSYGNSRLWNLDSGQFRVPADIGHNSMVD